MLRISRRLSRVTDEGHCLNRHKFLHLKKTNLFLCSSSACPGLVYITKPIFFFPVTASGYKRQFHECVCVQVPTEIVRNRVLPPDRCVHASALLQDIRAPTCRKVAHSFWVKTALKKSEWIWFHCCNICLWHSWHIHRPGEKAPPPQLSGFSFSLERVVFNVYLVSGVIFRHLSRM